MELEFRLNELQQTRKDLMVELEELMKVLKVQGSLQQQQPPLNKYGLNSMVGGGKVTRNQMMPQRSQYGSGMHVPHVAASGGMHVAGYGVRSPDNSETDSAPASNSMPASVNSLSE